MPTKSKKRRPRPVRHGYDEGGRVLPSSTDDNESWSDTFVRRPLAGLASMWGGIDPATGEFGETALHNLQRAWAGRPLSERRRLGLTMSAKALPGLVADAGGFALDAIPTGGPLGELLGGAQGREFSKRVLFDKPRFAADAEENESAIHAAAQDSLGLDDPHGLTENLMDSAGVMAGQLPLPGATTRKLAALKNRGLAGKVASAGIEYLSPTIDPRLRNYAAGTLFGGAVGGGSDLLVDAVAAQDREAQQQQWIAQALAEVLAEEQQGDDTSDDEALAELGFASAEPAPEGFAKGGRVGKALGAIESLRQNLAGIEDINLRKAKIEQALSALKGTEGLSDIDKIHLNTAGMGLADAARETLPGRRRQRFGDYERNILRLLEDRAPGLTERRTTPREPLVISNMAPPPALPSGNAGVHGLLSQQEWEQLLLKKPAFAEGGGVTRPGAPLSQDWFEQYGAGPEHLFFGERKVPDLPVGWAPMPQVPGGSGGGAGTSSSSTTGGLASVLGLVRQGRNLYDNYNRVRDLYDRYFGATDAAEGIAEEGANDLSGTESWVNSELGNVSMPGLAAGAGTIGGLGSLAGAGTPAGTVFITEGGGALASQLGAAGAGVGTAGGLAGLGSLAAGAEAGALAGLGTTAAATEASLLGMAAPTLAGSAGAGAGAGAAGAAGAGAAAGTALGAAAGLGIAALPLVFAATTPFGEEHHDETSQLRRAYAGLRLSPVNTQWGQELIRLPNGEHIDAKSVKHRLDDVYGKQSEAELMSWLMSQPRVAYTAPRLQRARGPNAPRGDYR